MQVRREKNLEAQSRRIARDEVAKSTEGMKDEGGFSKAR
jgi:hypothetical protein